MYSQGTEDKDVTIKHSFDLRQFAIVCSKLLLYGELLDLDLFDSQTEKLVHLTDSSLPSYK